MSRPMALERARSHDETPDSSSGPSAASRHHVPASGATVALPERLRLGSDADSDVDVTAPRTRRGQLLNQSFISMIANVGTNPGFAAGRFEAAAEGLGSIREGHVGGVGDGGGEEKDEVAELEPTQGPPTTRGADSDEERSHDEEDEEDEDDQRASSAEQTASSSTRHASSRLDSLRGQDMSTSQILPRRSTASQTGLESSSSVNRQKAAVTQDAANDDERDNDEPELAQDIANIFGFDQPEKLLGGYACSFLQSVMLQGFMYITSKHVCFYAYLPRRTTGVTKSGYLSKRGRQNINYTRYWFVLKGHVLSYYSNSKERYFPSGTIDLRADCSVEPEIAKSGESATFTIRSAGRRHTLRAESTTSAREWAKQLQQTIFRAQSTSDSVKIRLPVDNLLDVEESPVLDCATTIRLKVIDNDETYALDEYFFSFYEKGAEALQLLREQMADNNATKDLEAISASHQSLMNDQIQQSEQQQQQQQQRQRGVSAADSAPKDESEPSYTSDSSEAGGSMEASSILERSDLFRRPTIPPSRHSHRATTAKPHSKQKHVRTKSKAAKAKDAMHVRKRTPDSGSQPQTDLAGAIRESNSTSTLQGLFKAGAYPLQKASGIAGLIRNHSRHVGSLLATESRGYYERVSGMWAGKRTHYDESEGPLHDHALSEGEAEGDGEGDERVANFGHRFRTHFALPASEKLIATYFGHLQGTVLIYGKIYIGETKLCFRSLLPGTRTKMILPLRDVENVDKETGFRFGYSGLCLVVRGHEELFFEFGRPETRDDCAVTLLRALNGSRVLEETGILPPLDQSGALDARAEYESLVRAQTRHRRRNDRLDESDTSDSSPVLFDDLAVSMVDFKPGRSMRFTLLTIGSRGDVQPCLALARGLVADGHRVKIATHAEFGPWIKSHGIDFAPVAGEPAEIMRLCVENDMFTVAFFREALSKFTGWVDELLDSAWDACRDCDVLVESPSAMAGIHIAEALQIPYFRAFTMPWTRTRAYPHAFTVPTQKMGGNYNSFSYVMFDNLFWAPISGQVNRWRRRRLGLPPTTLDRMGANKTPFLYNFSPSVVPTPLDFNHWVHITGYWFLDEGVDYQPPRQLKDFIAQARADSKKIVYIGFGSIVVEDPAALTKTIVAAVLKADVRCILSKGWSERLGGGETTAADVALPAAVHQIKSAPHDWLFRQVDAAVHHGGAGTTGASLRAGIPTVIKPFFGDQYFFGSRVQDLGVGMCLKKINTTTLARAIWLATNSERIITKARVLGQRIRSENGVATAIQAIYRDLEYATSLIKRKPSRDDDNDDNDSTRRRTPPTAAETSTAEESWTLVDDDDDNGDLKSIAGASGD